MILRSIAVEGWRCFANRVEAGPFCEGLNVLHAPNGSGKSTLFEALRRALLDWHRVSGQEAEAMRPWGRKLAPTVTVEFAHQGAEYRLRKRFLSDPLAELERREHGRFMRLAEGDAVDETLRQILRHTPPGRGLARPENWGMAQILWVPQGQLELKPLSGDLAADVRSYLGAQVTGTAAGRLEKRIEELYAEYFTPTGKRRTGKGAGPAVLLEERLNAARERARDSQARFEDYEASARKVEDWRSVRAQARREADELSKALRETRLRLETHRELCGKRERQKADADRAESRYTALRKHIADIQETYRELRATESDLEQHRQTAQTLEREAESWDRQVADAKAALEDVRAKGVELERAEREAGQAERYVQCLRDIEDLEARLGRIAEAEASLSERKRERETCVAPDTKTLRAIRRAFDERKEAQTQIDSALITLEIVPAGPTSLRVVSGEELGEKALAPGIPARFRGSPEVVADVLGLGRIRASGPVQAVDEFRRQRDAAARRLEQFTEGYATADPEELEALSERAKELEGQVAQAETKLRTLLGGESREDLERERAKRVAVRTQLLISYPGWASQPPDVESLRETARALRCAYDAELLEAQARLDRAREALASATGQRDSARTRIEEGEKRLKSLSDRWGELTKDGKTPEERQAELGAAALAWDAAKSALQQIEERLADYTDDPADTVKRLEQQVQAAEQAATRALENEKTEEGRLEQLAAQGPYSALAQAQEEVAELERELAREKAREEAVRLLRETLRQCRAEAVASVAGPVQAAATRLFHRIAGRRLGPVRFGDGFQPVEVRPEIAEAEISLENISGGEKEQIFMAARLALAEVLARGERQLVVLDDVLLASDASRLARVLGVLEESAQRLQVVVLTCHPERYRGLGGAQFLDLEAVAASAGPGA